MRAGCGLSHRKWEHTLSFHGNHVVLILQDAFDHQKPFCDEKNSVLLEQVRRDDGIGNARFVFQAEKYETLSGAGTLARDDTSSDAKTSAAGNRFEFAGRMNTHCLHFGTTICHGMWSDRE